MKKELILGAGLVATTGIGVQQTHAEESGLIPEIISTTEVAPVVAEVKTFEEKQADVTNQQEVVNQEKAVLDKIQEKQAEADKVVKEQEAVVAKDEQAVNAQEAVVKAQEEKVNEAKALMEQATPEAIEKAKAEVDKALNTVTEKITDVENTQTSVTEREAVVAEKAKETTQAQKENDKNKASVMIAEKKLADVQALAKNTEKEKANAEAQKTALEQTITEKQADAQTQEEDMVKKQEQLEKAKAEVEKSEKELTDLEEYEIAKRVEINAKNTEIELKLQNKKQVEDTEVKIIEKLSFHKGINLPDNFTPDYYKVLSEADKMKMEKEAIEMNKEFPVTSKEETEKSAIMINVKNPTVEQKRYMSDYVVGMLNEVREKLGLQPLKVSNQAIKFAWDIAKYTNSQIYNHDENAINKAAEENGFKIQKFYENLSIGTVKIKEDEVSMLDFEKGIRVTLVGMVFYNNEVSYENLNSLLDNSNTNMAVSISGENNDISGKIHIIVYDKDKLVDPTMYEDGTVPIFKTKRTLEQELAVAQKQVSDADTVLTTAKKEKNKLLKDLKSAKEGQKQTKQLITAKRELLTKAEGAYNASKAGHDEIVRQLTEAENGLRTTTERLGTINDLIMNRLAVIRGAEVAVDEAKKAEALSAKTLQEKQEAQEKEEKQLTTVKQALATANKELQEAQTYLKESQQFVARLENAQTLLVKAEEVLEKANASLMKAKIAQKASLEKLEALKETQKVTHKTYEQAKAVYETEKIKLDAFGKELQAEKDKQAKLALQEQMAKEHARLEALAKAKKEQEMKQASTKGKNTQPPMPNSKDSMMAHSSVNLMDTKNQETKLIVMNEEKSKAEIKETPKGMTRAEYREMKAEKSSTLPMTGEKRNNGMIFAGLAVFAGLLGLASADLKRKYKKQ
ncbi:SEC10/PgrA surface exclusion domain-containing protein [Enterococcus faecalis]|uniref:SEC10/PgrA surface exclusion domain-containing protein n=1 Tax=Enterococcus faecalis TaxID=1351 RepID=UPI001D187F2D|nr:SEC10/PgrA surface exclusion domain-containing protein [Enterococcus faecalis]MCC4085796.1 SEC10/PgrA surface exclusion domain-containing protein [Enterococcus faecalis]